MMYTKAQMLLMLQKNIPNLNILPIYIIYTDDFQKKKQETIDGILEFAKNRRLIIRSSSLSEDTFEFSNAGKYSTVLDVEPEYIAVKAAIEKVCNSYEKQKNEEILIQPMLKNVVLSGVVFTADTESLADYYIVNYCEDSDTSAVTAGKGKELKTFIHYKEAPEPIENSILDVLLQQCKNIEFFLQNDALDIEFAINQNSNIYILQVRPIARCKKENCEKIDLSNALKRIYKKVNKLSAPHPFLLGHTTCFGVMPDWNPAEILGVRPKKLAISLYKELITDNIWAHQRYDYGYRDLTMHPLMISFCGIPYIDTRVTFNSFVPQQLNERIADKLVNYYLDKLAKYPKYHDKIEFEIVFSCYYLGIHDKLRSLLEFGFNENEITRIEFSLLELTNNIISPKIGLYRKDIEKIYVLEENYEKIVSADIAIVDKIYWLIEECKTYGTLPFAGVARAAFIAIQFLNSFVDMKIISRDDYDAYMKSLETVSKRLNYDLHRYYKGEMTRKEFTDIYGHIRPGTYDIMSECYEDAFDDYFEDSKFTITKEIEAPFSFSDNQLALIQTELDENGLLISAEELMVFIKESIEGREQLKFAFSKLVSMILKLIEELGHKLGISKEDMAHLDVSVVKQLYVDLYTGDIRTVFEENIRNNKVQYESAVRIKLPSIIVSAKDVYSFYLLSEEPNFITQKNVIADVVRLIDGDCVLNGKIVFIQAADPGYDFLFSKRIGGLITQFGGANSHMAIRCAELGIPAVIGVGEKNYAEWSNYKRILIDCLNKQVIKIK